MKYIHLPVDERVNNFKDMHDLLHDNNNAPLNIVHLFEKMSSTHSYYTRSSTSEKYYVKSSRLEIQKHSFSRLGVKLWNEIPSHITDLPKKRSKWYFTNCFLLSWKK